MNIVLIDDHGLFSNGLKSVLEQEEDINMVKVFDGKDINEVDRYIFENKIDIVLLDIHLGKADGLKIGEQLLNRQPSINLLFLTGYDYPEYRRLASGIGAKGFLSKSMNPPDLADKLRIIVSGGELEISDAPTKKILNDNELETLQLLCTGISNAAIAQELNISERGVDHRIKSIKKKLSVSSTQEAAIKGVKLGLVRMHN